MHYGHDVIEQSLKNLASVHASMHAKIDSINARVASGNLDQVREELRDLKAFSSKHYQSSLCDSQLFITALSILWSRQSGTLTDDEMNRMNKAFADASESQEAMNQYLRARIAELEAPKA